MLARAWGRVSGAGQRGHRPSPMSQRGPAGGVRVGRRHRPAFTAVVASKKLTIRRFWEPRAGRARRQAWRRGRSPEGDWQRAHHGPALDRPTIQAPWRWPGLRRGRLGSAARAHDLRHIARPKRLAGIPPLTLAVRAPLRGPLRPLKPGVPTAPATEQFTVNQYGLHNGLSIPHSSEKVK
jgi:hypothetical protein